MKYIYQLAIILFISFISEILYSLIPLPIPASIYGMVIMFAALMTGVLKPDHVRETGKFLVEIMPVMFIPASVGLIDAWPSLKGFLIPLIVITVVSTFVVMVVSGRTSQLIIRKECGGKCSK